MIRVDEHSYLFLIERGDASFGAWAPDLPGCVATAETLEDCERLMREAIAFHLDGMRAEGEQLPEPSVAAASVAPAA
jgi:predicted RNase H-like HicB family nuclease